MSRCSLKELKRKYVFQNFEVLFKIVQYIVWKWLLKNNLWFHYLHGLQKQEHKSYNEAITAVAKKLTDVASYELWHHCLGHPGEKVMDSIVNDKIEGVPKLRKNQFYCCAACLSAKFKKSHIGDTKKYDKSVKQISPNTYAIFMMLSSIKVPTVYLPTFRWAKIKYLWSHTFYEIMWTNGQISPNTCANSW